MPTSTWELSAVRTDLEYRFLKGIIRLLIHPPYAGYGSLVNDSQGPAVLPARRLRQALPFSRVAECFAPAGTSVVIVSGPGSSPVRLS